MEIIQQRIIQQLLAIYLGILLFNLALSGWLWFRQRATLNRYLVQVWASGCLFAAFQAIPGRGILWEAVSCLPSFLVSVSLANLVGQLSKSAIPARRYWAAAFVAPFLSTAIYFAGGPFWAVALPPSAAVAYPVIDTPLRVLLRRDGSLTSAGKALLLSMLAFGVHDLDYPFMRNRPELAVAGFTIAVLLLFLVSVTAPATVLERVSEERTRAHEQNQFQRNFFANVTHELRTPLTMILAPMESLLGGEFGSLGATQRIYLEAGWRSGVRLLKLINDLLDLAKLEEGFLKLRQERTDLRTMLENLVRDAQPLAERKGLSLELVVEAAPTNLYADGEQIERVLVNLISNGLKFTEAGGVTIRLGGHDGAVEIVVEDTGIGISAADLPLIFQRFQQGDATVTRRFGGTGIGLAYAKEIVELHGGRIEASSTPGKGSRFVVHLKEGIDQIPANVRDTDTPPGMPRAPGERLKQENEYRFAEIAVPMATVDRIRGPGHGGARILLVEDNVEILELISLHLRDSHSVFTASDGEQGLEIARRERPDLIVTDFMMPKMDGLTMLKALRADPKMADVPVIMLTSRNQLDDRLSGREAGADVYLTKPFSPRELEAAIRQQLTKRGLQVQNLMRAHIEGLEIVSAGLAHEIQNPLNFIKNAQHLIAENVAKLRQVLAGLDTADPVRTATVDKAQQKITRMVESANRGVQRIEEVVGLMRRYAREGYPTEPIAVDLDRAVSDVVELVAPAAEVQCQVTLDLESAGYLVHIVPEDLNQVIRSLLQNSVEALDGRPGSGKIALRTRATQHEVVLEVVDNGPGIPPDNMRRIFSPFFSTKIGSGRGLGLPVVQIVVSRAGGIVTVTSVPDVETTFRVQLPAVPAAATVGHRSSSQPASGAAAS
jgi:signal transduction histidine kinase